MMLIDEMMTCINAFRLKKVTPTKSLKQSVIFFWKATLIPMIILLIVVAAAGWAASSASVGTYPARAGGFSGLLVVFAFFAWLVLAPIGIAEGSGVVHFFGRLWGNFKNQYEQSYNTVACIAGASILALLVLFILTLLLSLGGTVGTVIAIIIDVIGVIWLFVAFVSLLAKMQNTTIGGAFLALIVPILLVIMVYGLILIAGLFSLGVFNSGIV